MTHRVFTAVATWQALVFLLLIASLVPDGHTTGARDFEFEVRVTSGQSIQQAINDASNGDVIIVDPGVYVENLNFLGKAITLESALGATETVIDGGSKFLPVVVFDSGEGRNSILRGFTLTNGSDVEGGGIRIINSSPSILNNVVTGNSASALGGGIGMGFSSPLIQGNTVSGNVADDGGGISIRGESSAKVIDNQIVGNTAGHGGGIRLFGAGYPEIRGNSIIQNVATRADHSWGGGGIDMVNLSDALIVQNLIVGNTAYRGGGVAWVTPDYGTGPTLINNTIALNYGELGSAIHADGSDQEALIANNLIIALGEQTALNCGDSRPGRPNLRFNNVFSPLGEVYGELCNIESEGEGNITADPKFANPASNDFRLASGSLAIDAGSNAMPNIPSTDLDGVDRIVDGNRDGLAVVDMGAYEFDRIFGSGFEIETDP
ncbi:MAG: hypothetical protein DHS20C11_24290 [Lysobacteraceae bacterium]|nr:MAG: hypothetical protein DHS20C11_24290 [Xanthomonadaceae bacterium]